MSSEILWYFSRSAGVVSIALLTAVVVLGTRVASHRASASASTVRMALHRWLTVGLLVFLGLHIATAVLEGYVKLSWLAVVVPFVSAWQPLWVGLGALAVDLLIAVAVSSWLRHRIPERAWRAVHWLTYALWPLAIAHGLMLGTANEPLLRGITIACAGIGVAFAALRSVSTFADRDRRRDVLAQEWS